ncbi:MAG TPA: TldD/PmbA family protein [Candidatus Thermoplasmatota archaeon]
MSASPDPIAEYAVRRARKLGADEAVALVQDMRANQTRMANNQITLAVEWRDRSASLFISRKGRTTTTEVDNPSRGRIDVALARILKFVRRLPVNEDYRGIASRNFAQPRSEPDAGIAAGRGATNEIMADARDAALKAGAARAAGTAYTSSTRSTVATSAGALVAAHTTGATVSVRAFTDRDASGHWVHASSTLKGLDAKGSGRHAGRIAKRARHPEMGKAGKYDVVFDPLAIAALTSNLGSMASATAVEAGFSYLGGLIGKSVASKAVTIAEDGTLKGGLESCPFDLEGQPTRRNVVVDRGRLVTYLHNTSTGTRHHAASTGNASFGHFAGTGDAGGVINPSPWNLEMVAGRRSAESLFSMVDRGLYVTNIWYTRYQNYVAGDFSTIPRDGMFRIEGGELAGPVRDLRISENMRKFFQKVEALSKDGRQIQSWECETPTLQPYALVRRVSVTKSAQ